MVVEVAQDSLVIAGKPVRSRLMLGTGKYRNAEEMNAALDAAGAEVVPVATRRPRRDPPRDPAEHGRLLHGRGRGAGRPARPRADRLDVGQARGDLGPEV